MSSYIWYELNIKRDVLVCVQVVRQVHTLLAAEARAAQQIQEYGPRKLSAGVHETLVRHGGHQ